MPRTKPVRNKTPPKPKRLKNETETETKIVETIVVQTEKSVTKKETKMPAIKPINFSGAGRALVAEGTYTFALKDVTGKQTRTKKDMVTIAALVKGDDQGNETEFDGKTMFRNYVIDPDPAADNAGTLYYLQRDLLLFGADEADVTADDVDVIALGKSLKGNTTLGEVTHSPDSRDPNVMQHSVNFKDNNDYV